MNGNKSANHKKRHMVVTLVFALFLCSPLSSAAQNISGKTEVHFIDVGQADAILVMSPNRECVMLIDSGDTRYPGSSKNFRAYMESKLPLQSRIDLVVASHPHADHIGSMKWVLENYQVKTYIDNSHEVPRITEKGHPTLFGRLMGEIALQVSEGRLKRVAFNDAIPEEQDFCPSAENLNSMLLFPSGGFDQAECDKNPNDCSLLIKMTYGSTSFLFPGDAEDKLEERLLEDPDVKSRLAAQVLKAPHHGSDTSSTQGFLDAVSPEWIIVSVGKKDTGTNATYMLPRLTTLRRFLAFTTGSESPRQIDAYDKDNKVWALLGVSGNLFVTSKDGTAVISTDGNKISKD